MIYLQDQFLASPLKWAGGKRWLTSDYSDLFPLEFANYYEPFLGGASVFLHLNPKHAILADVNADLIKAYRAIADNWKAVCKHLTRHNKLHSEEHYYTLHANPPKNEHARAAWFLYMNRACYNGLYRVNRKGEFNVPIGSKQRMLLSTDDFEGIAQRFTKAKLLISDFESVIKQSSAGDFVYVDPPYTVKHNNNGFVKYNEQIFSWEDQERLSVSIKSAINRGVMVAVSNADHKSVIDLYRGYGEIVSLSRRSTIGGKNASRAATTEIFFKSGY